MSRNDIQNHLRENLYAGNVVPFVGAGLSVGAGLPNWYQLISELSAKVDYQLPPLQWVSSDGLIDAAQYYVNHAGLHSLHAHLKNSLDSSGKKPSRAHQLLADLPVSIIFTANYDNFLERAFQDAGKRVQVVVNDVDIPFMRHDLGSVNIVKLYGDLDQLETIVLARQQYEPFFLKHPQMVKMLETELARSNFLYLGWSQTDPHFNLIFGELLSRLGQYMHGGLAVMFDVADALKHDLQRKQIQLIELPSDGDRTEELAKFLEKLIKSS